MATPYNSYVALASAVQSATMTNNFSPALTNEYTAYAQYLSTDNQLSATQVQSLMTFDPSAANQALGNTTFNEAFGNTMSFWQGNFTIANTQVPKIMVYGCGAALLFLILK